MTTHELTGLAEWAADTSEPLLELSTGDLLRAAAAEAPGTVAIREVSPPGALCLTGAQETDRAWTYAELLADAEICAAWLLGRFTPGERVVVWAPNVPEWIVLQYGAALAGLVLVTANPALRAGELRYVLTQSRASGVFYTDAFRGTDMAAIAAEATEGLADVREKVRFEEWPILMAEVGDERPALPPVLATDPAQIQYTSGTTGFPKGALLTHRGLITNARYVAARARLPHGGSFISGMPLFHTAGCALSVLGTAVRRGTLIQLQLFDPGLMLAAIARHQPDTVLGVPTMLIALLDHPDFADTDVGGVEVVLSGGALVPPELVRRIEKQFGCWFTIVYGQTELSPVLTQTGPDDSAQDRACTVGRPLWNVEVKLVDADGNTVGIDVQGEVCARGYQVMNSYFDMPERSAETVDADGWLHTGDLGTLDARGYVRITGRLKDMIIRGGENMFPAEIEQVLFSHPAVADVVVVGMPDPLLGERVAAVVRLADPGTVPSAAELRALCRAHLAPAKAPADWYVTDAFPLTGSGKPQKFRVQELVAAGEYGVLA